jgi:hypothetical protein
MHLQEKPRRPLCNHRGMLQEEHPLVRGKPSGVERWWVDARTIYEETHWLNGTWHGPRRDWRGSKLEGPPQFFIRGKRVSKRVYLKASRTDSTLPPYRPADDSPKRTLPAECIRLRRRARARQKR